MEAEIDRLRGLLKRHHRCWLDREIDGYQDSGLCAETRDAILKD